MNKKLLKAKVREATGSKAMLAELRNLLQLSEHTLVAKTNGRTEWRPSEIDKMRIRYRLTDAETIEIFIKQEETQA